MFYISKLKKDINRHIRLKSYVLNNENLSKALNEKGEILIIHQMISVIMGKKFAKQKMEKVNYCNSLK